MDASRAKAIQKALGEASTEYLGAAQDEMNRGYGSVHNVYDFVKESRALETKARNLYRRWAIDSCNCA